MEVSQIGLMDHVRLLADMVKEYGTDIATIHIHDMVVLVVLVLIWKRWFVVLLHAQVIFYIQAYNYSPFRDDVFNSFQHELMKYLGNLNECHEVNKYHT